MYSCCNLGPSMNSDVSPQTHAAKYSGGMGQLEHPPCLPGCAPGPLKRIQGNTGLTGMSGSKDGIWHSFAFSEHSPTAAKVSSQRGYVAFWCKARARLLLKDPGRGGGAWPAPADPPHIRIIFQQKMKFINGAGNLRPILGTQTFVWPLTHPHNPPPSGFSLSNSLGRVIWYL